MTVDPAPPCPVCGGRNRPGGNGCWDCFWDEDIEAMNNPDEVVRPNYVSLNEAKALFHRVGLAELRKANSSEGELIRRKFRDQ